MNVKKCPYKCMQCGKICTARNIYIVKCYTMEREASLNALNVEKFQQWMSAIYAQNVENYLTNESCYACTNCGECLTMVNTCMCNKCGQIFYKLL